MVNNESPENSILILKSISQFLKQYRILEGYSQDEVAQESGLHRNSISRIENAKNTNLTSLIKLTEFYQLPLVELFSTVGES